MMTNASRGKNEMLESLENVLKEMDPKGPFFLGDQLSYVDLMLAPFALRMEPVLGYFRGLTVRALYIIVFLFFPSAE